MAASIDPGTAIGSVHLTVRDLDRMVTYYRDRLGFAVHERTGGVARLGAGAAPLLVLVEDPAAPIASGTTGLYHFAVLLPSRALLAAALRHIARLSTPIRGASDHRVSEALYLHDPEDNGIEIYRDRPREEWPREGTAIAMATAPLELDDLLAEPAPQQGGWTLSEGTVIGHVHFHVAGIAAAEAFYCGVLGFDLVTRYGSTATFVSAGGYHHHIGFNTWAGVGAPPPPPGAAGLRHVELRLPDAGAREGVVERVRGAGLPVVETPAGPLVRDPSGNALVLAV